jgi:hypothetical protein
MYMGTNYDTSIHSTSPSIPSSTYLAPSSCDRNRPPQSQVARKLSPLSPIAPVYPSLPQLPSLLGFPGPNVLLIRTHPNPFPQCTAQLFDYQYLSLQVLLIENIHLAFQQLHVNLDDCKFCMCVSGIGKRLSC